MSGKFAENGLIDSDKAEVIKSILAELSGKNLESARFYLHQNWPFPASRQIPPRRTFSVRQQFDVFQRDCFYCRYCQSRTVFLGSLSLMTRLLPKDFPCHPNWKLTDTHPAYLALSATLDHVVPVARGGADDPSNIVTACWKCNSIKGPWLLDEIRWTLKEPPSEPWDGLVGLFMKAMDSNSVDDKGLRAWHRILKGRMMGC